MRVLPWLLLLAAACSPSGPGAPSEADLCSRIAAHRWWSAKVTPDDVRRIGQAVVDAGGSDVVWIDDSGKVTVARKPAGGDLERMKRPEGVGKRNAVFDMRRRFDARPTLRQVLEHLAHSLDSQAYRE